MTAREAPTPPQNPGSTEPSGEPATYVYRLRSTKYLLGEHQELKRQEIYFAKPEELNDPMEGYRDVIWQGDRIVWNNFFYHYISCLMQTFVEAIVVGDKFAVTTDTIPVRNPLEAIHLRSHPLSPTTSTREPLNNLILIS